MRKQKIFIGVFLALIYGVLGFYALKQVLISTGKIDLVMTDNWKFFEPEKERNIVDKLNNKFGSVKMTLENKSNNYFPLYLQLNGLYEGVNFNLNKLVYEDVPLRMNVGGEYLFYNTKHGFYYLEAKQNSDELKENYQKQVKFFNGLAEKGINANIYMLTGYELTNLKPNNLSGYVSDFKKDLNDKINLKVMEIGSIEEYKEKFYKTDHHWNMKGALEGYYGIMEMLGKQPMAGLEAKEVSDVKYYGSMAKTAMNTSVYDHIMDVDVRPKYDVTVNGAEPEKKFKPRVMPERNNIFYDYYVGYFDGQYEEVVYDYHQPGAGNLLMMCDSYAWQIDYLVASAYDKTYVVNVRYGDGFDMEQYIKDNNITDVLFLYEGMSLMFDENGYNFEGMVK
ncbi:MAG: hypothetical protein Q4E47_02375 [Candidatus Saccharibacteria bacterium]|nr:hypothetical protein [Candidatus Saccharibacteria bacterium]